MENSYCFIWKVITDNSTFVLSFSYDVLIHSSKNSFMKQVKFYLVVIAAFVLFAAILVMVMPLVNDRLFSLYV